MVKNYGGGDKMKHMARKHVNGAKNAQSSKLLRTAMCDDEKYGYVVRILGNGNCIVKGFDGYERMCHIRGKFTGRSKRENTLVAGTWVLVGLRPWDSEKEFSSKQTKTSKNIQKCDLLEIYTPAERDKLRVQEKIFQDIDSENSDDEFKLSKQSVEFMDQETLEYHEIVEQDGKLSRMKKSSYLDIYENITSSSEDSDEDSDDDSGGGGDAAVLDRDNNRSADIQARPQHQKPAPVVQHPKQQSHSKYNFQDVDIDIDDI